MLPASYRLPSTRISFVMHQGKRFGSNGPLLFVVKSAGNSSTQFAFVVTTRASKESTRRNRLKRLLRESVQTLYPRIPMGYEAVLLLTRDPQWERAEEASMVIEQLLGQSGILPS